MAGGICLSKVVRRISPAFFCGRGWKGERWCDRIGLNGIGGGK